MRPHPMERTELVRVGADVTALRSSDGSSLRDLLTACFRLKARVVVVAVLVTSLVAAVTFALPPAYEARSAVLVKFGREYVYHPEVGQERPLINVTAEEVLNSEVQILTSYGLLREVVEAVTLPKLYPPAFGKKWSAPTLDDAAKRLAKELEVEAVKRSSGVLHVAFEHRNPKIAAQVVNTLVERYKEKHLELFSDGKSDFLQGELASYAEKLKRSEEKLERFRQEHGVFAYKVQMDLLLRRRGELEADLKGAQLKLRESKRRKGTLQNAMRHRSYRAEVRSDMEKEVVQMMADTRTYETRIGSLEPMLQEVGVQIQQLDLSEREYETIRRELADDEKNHHAYKVKAEEMRLSSELDKRKVSNISVIYPAAVPTSRSRPNVGLNLAVGALFGLLTGILYAILTAHLRQGMATPESAERRLGLPVLVTIPLRKA